MEFFLITWQNLTLFRKNYKQTILGEDSKVKLIRSLWRYWKRRYFNTFLITFTEIVHKMLDTLLLPVSLALLCYAIYKWVKKNDDYFIKRNILHLRPSFLFGNTGKFFLKLVRPTEFFQYMYYSFPNEK